MSASTEVHGGGQSEIHSGDHGLDEAAHRSDLYYIRIAAVLFVLTAIEVSTYYQNFGPIFLPLLIVLMTIKFFTVVLFFMHLKFDNRLFGMLFYAGFGLAISVYLIALTTFHFWG
jgi:cytochrome c oxidase subunit 4